MLEGSFAYLYKILEEVRELPQAGHEMFVVEITCSGSGALSV